MEVKPGYKQTEVGVIPQDWGITTLGESCQLVTKGTTPTSLGRNFTKSGINFLKAESISETGKTIPDKVAFIDEATHAVLKRSQLMAGDLLVSIAGVLGRTGLVERKDLPANTNQALAIVRLGKHSVVNRDFLFYCLRSPVIERQIRDINVQAAQANISLQNVRDFCLPHPPTKAEQEAIAQALSDVDALIGALDSALAKKRDLKQAAMQQLLSGQKRLAGFGERVAFSKRTATGEFPGDWELVPLSRVSAFITKGSTPTTYGFEWRSSGVLFLRSECVSDRGLDLSESMFIAPEAHQLLKRSEVKGGDILMTITGNVGRVVPLGQDFPPANINQHIARIRIIEDQIAASYVFHFLAQPLVRKYYKQIITGQAYPQISLTQVRDTVLPMPSFPEQNAIAEVLSDMDAELAALTQRRDKTRALKQGMMQELLTGRTRLV